METWWIYGGPGGQGCHWITTVETDSGYHVAFTTVPSSKHLCHYGCELQRMRPGNNPNRQLDNLRPAALHPRSSGSSSLRANCITKTVFNQVLPVPSSTPSLLLIHSQISVSYSLRQARNKVNKEK